MQTYQSFRNNVRKNQTHFDISACIQQHINFRCIVRKKRQPKENNEMEEQNHQQQNQEPIGASVLTQNIYYEGNDLQRESINASNLTENPYYE